MRSTHRLIRLKQQTTPEERIGAQPERIKINIKKLEDPVVWNIFHDLLQLLIKCFFTKSYKKKEVKGNFLEEKLTSGSKSSLSEEEVLKISGLAGPKC